jgi:hypothetical protein
MKITNRMGLPEPIVKAVTAHVHRGADYSASMLSQSPRMVWLKRRHDDEIEEDVSDRIWAMLGTAAHYVVENAGGDNILQEGYIEAKVGDVTLSGTFDLYDGEELTDVKTLSVWSIIYGDKTNEWEKQLNTYAYLLRSIGFSVKRLSIVAIMRDWSKSKAKLDASYPQAQAIKIPVKLWSDDASRAYVEESIEHFELNKNTPDDDLPECTAEERWQSETVYAVMKDGRKSAVKLHDSIEAASAHVIELGKGHQVVVRPGEWKRCADYCNVCRFCSQYKNKETEEIK